MGKTYSQINIGDKDEVAKTISETDVYLFAGITGDFNPAHLNEEFMKNSHFGGRIAHGTLSAGFISTVLGMYLPGPGTVYLSQTINFLYPVKVGDTLRTECVVIEKLPKGRIKLKTTCYVGNRVVTDGEALVIAPRDVEC